MKFYLEKSDISKFEDFYKQLDDKNNIIYMYFTSGLLHFVLESARWVPQEVNLVLVAAGLSQEEIGIVKKYTNRPVCALNKAYNDGVIWELLFVKNYFNFGWLDIDCFVFDQSIFSDITKLGSDIGANTVWACKYDRYDINEWLANTYFTFYNVSVIRKLLDKYAYLSPKLAKLPEKQLENFEESSYIIIEDEHLEFIHKHFREYKSNSRGYFDTTHLYQLYMLAEGYKLNRIRDVDSLREYYFSGALHLGGCNRIHIYKLDDPRSNKVFRFNMRVSYLLLNKYLNILPQQYHELYEVFTNNIIDNKLSIDKEDIKIKINEFLKANKMDETVFDFNSFCITNTERFK